MVLDALDRGYYAQARELAQKLRAQGLAEDEQGLPDFVYGVVAAHEAEELSGDETRNYYLLATRYLEESRKRGFPPGREAEGLLLLGQSLFSSGRLTDSLPVLEEALLVDSPQQSAIHQLLAGAYASAKKPDLNRALAHIEALLDDDDLPAEQRQAGQLRQAQILWQMEDMAGCAKALEQIPAQALVRPEADLLRGQLLMRAAIAAKKALSAEPDEAQRLAVKKQFDATIEVLRHAQDDPLAAQTIRRAMYLIGSCYKEMADYRAALAQFERTRNVYLDTPEGAAAALEEADVLRLLGRGEDAVAAYRRALGAVPEDKQFANPWIPLEQFRERVVAAYEDYLHSDQFENAIAVAERMWPLFDQSQAAERYADAYRDWARRLLASSDQLPEPASGEASKRGRELLRKAGELYSQLAQINYATRLYPDVLWQAAECYLDGHDFSAAVKSLEEYLQHELRRRRPLALVRLGESLLALNRLDEALAVLKEDIEFHSKDASSYAARLLAARAHLEKGEAAEAESLLRENLNGELLTPESKEWRESLFALGEMLHSAGRHEEAIQRLEEAVERYAETRSAIKARYLIAEAHRQLAKHAQEKLAEATIETARLTLNKQMHQALASAISYYERAQESLNARQEKTELSPLEKTILRNSYFAVGAAYFDLGRFEEAIRAYSVATTRYQHHPEVLEAFVQIASCYRRLNKPLEARGAIQQAKVVLARMSQDADFKQTTNFDRKQWRDMLDWLSSL